MPRRARLEGKTKTRRLVVHQLYFSLLYEICVDHLKMDNIAKCLEYIIKDLYDTLVSEESTAEATKEERKEEKKEVRRREEETPRFVPPPPP